MGHELCTSVSYSIKINGYPQKPFKANRESRQGDPMSPYLFAIFMEYIYRLLGRVKEEVGFNFHPRCRMVGLTHLLFADDLFVFCKGDLSSVLAVKASLDKFSASLSLVANVSKSAMYMAGIGEVEKHVLLERLVWLRVHCLFGIWVFHWLLRSFPLASVDH